MEILVGRYVDDNNPRRRKSSYLFPHEKYGEKLSGRSNGHSFNIHGGIPIDSVPLNWNKMPLMKNVLEILKLCFDKYNEPETMNVNTS